MFFQKKIQKRELDKGSVKTSNIVQSLWIGDSLSGLSNMCLRSFLKHGHEFHLYVYEPISNIPNGVIVKDASEILKKENIFYITKGSNKGSIAPFSDLFRYKLLLMNGGWWVDTDAYCLRRFDFEDEYVFGKESRTHVANGVMHAPKESKLMDDLFATAKNYKGKIVWGEIGPALLKKKIIEHKLQKYCYSPEVFYPIHYKKYKNLFKSRSTQWVPPINSVSVHFWNTMINRNTMCKPQKNSIYYQLEDCL